MGSSPLSVNTSRFNTVNIDAGGDDFAGARAIGNIGNAFTIQPVTSTNRIGAPNNDPFSQNANSAEILVDTNGFVVGVRPVTSNGRFFNSSFANPFPQNTTPPELLFGTPTALRTEVSQNPNTIFPLANEPFPFFQGVPALGTNPDSAKILSASTQFQANLEQVGPAAIPGFPVVGFGKFPDAVDFLGGTESFNRAIAPHHPLASPNGVFFPADNGSGLFYPPPPIQPPYDYAGSPFQPTHYPQFAPYSGTGVNPSQIPYPAGGTGSVPSSGGRVGVPRFSVSNPAYPGTFNKYFAPFFRPQVPVSTNPIAPEPVGVVRNNPFKLPGIIPTNAPGGVQNFIDQFNQLPEHKKVELRRELINPTMANDRILNTTGVTVTGGRFNQGEVTNPFKSRIFLRDGNPFAKFNSGLIVTNGNDNGKVKGTPVKDLLVGTLNRNNIIDGQGGEDDIVGSTKRDLINVHGGDQVFTDIGEDFMFFDFTKSKPNATRRTLIDGGGDKDILVLTVPGNPTLESGTPVFKRLDNGALSVSLNGIEIFVRNIERFVIADPFGNIGSVFEPTA